ncbi:cell wall synthesis protein CwsA [Mycolicibacterium fluoranthenivorans]|uniref:Cell wall synthesis protein CwsA n=1 Tax=Mycolicibacterium fluoranthenivorans TaxID=258505 RepID=A0A7G8PG46_9MYCO|nr:cell wall synthesis protein CwsA [Mycolicibacterium fluoranthenivorans]QNJ93312.1 cell wall synthesis protein CwsA [Mycolicibacterium fluoranthenivorans]
MSNETDTRLTPGQRLAQGLKYSMVGPVDVTRGTLALGLSSAATSTAWLGRRIRQARPAPGHLRHRRRPLLYVVLGAAVLAVGAVTFSIVRRSMRPDPSTLPPSVEINPTP